MLDSRLHPETWHLDKQWAGRIQIDSPVSGCVHGIRSPERENGGT
jgi:hypothetical protein